MRVYSLDFQESVEFHLDDLTPGGPGWGEYIKGVAWALQEDGYALAGWEGCLAGDVPVGAGLSSSAALELATARAFATVSDLPWSPVQMALLAQKAENQWVGVHCGIMDQMISAGGKVGHALLIDCRSLELSPAPIPQNTVVVIMDTGTRRGLVDSAYNERRSQCESAARVLGVRALRDADLAGLSAHAGVLDPLAYKRARHVISENQRTLRAVEAMQRADAVELGVLMQASHASLRDDFEVSCRELDVMVELAQRASGCFGARMTGAGFGGCAVALVRQAVSETFFSEVNHNYQLATGIEARLYICSATDGASVSRV